MPLPAFCRYSHRLMEAPPSVVVAARVAVVLPAVTVNVASGGLCGTPATMIDAYAGPLEPALLNARTSK